MNGYRGRFAPSPTGDLHAGSLLAALGSWLLARRAGGRWIVRIEDIDSPRAVPGAAERQLNTLAAFGLVSDEPVVRQSDRHARYEAALERLLASGSAFPCYCSRAELAAVGGIHRACVQGHVPGRTPAVRFRVPDDCKIAFDDTILGRVHQRVDIDVGDFVLFRADGVWAYQLAVVVDDAEQRITEVVRGVDLLHSTPRQILLQRALGLPVPRHAHLPLVLDVDGNKLSKSDAARPLDLADPLPALRRAWAELGQHGDADARAVDVGTWLVQAVERFQPERIPHTGARHTQATDRA